MKTLLCALALTLSTSSFAATETRFNCRFHEDSTQVSAVFIVNNLNGTELSLKDILPESDETINSPISFKYREKGARTSVTPVNPTDKLYAGVLNMGAAVERIKNEKGFETLTLRSDDCCVNASLVLYQNSKFTRGYFQAVSCGGGKPVYSKVTCTLSK